MGYILDLRGKKSGGGAGSPRARFGLLLTSTALKAAMLLEYRCKGTTDVLQQELS